jgi:hypothetical protein
MYFDFGIILWSVSSQPFELIFENTGNVAIIDPDDCFSGMFKKFWIVQSIETEGVK